MPADKDRPSTWGAFRASLCDSCVASCCSMPVEIRFSDLVRLGLADEGEQSYKRILRVNKDVLQSYRSATELYLLRPRSDGACVFLGADRRCTVYERRPDTCRDFPTKVGPRVGFCPYKAVPIKVAKRG